MCDIARIYMKEEILRAMCNICIILCIMGLLLISFVHTPESITAGFAVIGVACGIGFICGGILDKLVRQERAGKRRQMEIREQDERDIRTGKFGYIYHPEYSFIQYLADNDTDLTELLKIIDDPAYPPKDINDVYSHYLNCEPQKKHQEKEAVDRMVIRARTDLWSNKKAPTL